MAVSEKKARVVSTLDVAIRVYFLLPLRKRKEAVRLLVVMVFAAGFETAGIASVAPLIAVLTDAQSISIPSPVRNLLNATGLPFSENSVAVVGSVVFTLILTGNFGSAFSLWLQHRYVADVQRNLAESLFNRYATRRYEFHIRNDSSVLTNNIFTHVNAVVNQALLPIVLGTSRLIIVLFILALLVSVNTKVALLSITLLGLSYFFVFLLTRRSQGVLGIAVGEAAERRYRVALETFGGVKELKVFRRIQPAIDRFSAASHEYFSAATKSTLLSVLPRYVLESLAFGGIILFAIASSGTDRDSVPLIAVFAFAGYRLMPALQQLYATANTLQFSVFSIEALEQELLVSSATSDLEADDVNGQDKTRNRPPSVSPTILFRNVSFRYPGTQRQVLDRLSLEIQPRQVVGIVGQTGSGKTTLVDLLLGLYSPTSGDIDFVFHGDPSSTSMGRAAVNFGYVPQSVFLANDTITANVAFGVTDSDVNVARVHAAAKLAQADEFISQLPTGYNSAVGERGVKLSGGQRQRLGIARALYENPSIVVFDEATSALDGGTETDVMTALLSLAGTRTIIIIAHRFKTVERCDVIFVLSDGKVSDSGKYDELVERSVEFKRLMGSSRSAEAC
jgi:ABC-type multidrug transport system fused ATPase/permease subunit